MNNIAVRRAVAVMIAPLIASLVIAPSAAAAPPPTQGVKVIKIGDPIWTLVDFHVFTAPIGTAASEYAEFTQTTEALLPPPNHLPNADIGIGPGQPHVPPYDNELAVGVAAQGYHQGTRFRLSDFSNSMGVWAVWMGVPAPGVIGRSPDFSVGPVIPNDVYPVQVTGSSSHNGAPFSELAEFDVIALNTLTPPLDVDGASHFPFFFADNADFGPAGARLAGSYRWQITMTDATGNGWQVQVHFTVTP